MRWLGNMRLQIVMRWSPILLALLAGCASNPFIKTPVTPSLPSPLTDASLDDLSVLTWVGGLCILFGTIAMVIPILSTFKGGTAIVIGVLLILLNIAVKEYLDWIYVPIIIGAAAITLSVAYKTVKRILSRRKRCQHSSEPYGSLFWWQPPGSAQELGSDRGSQSSSSPQTNSLKEENDATEDTRDTNS